MIPSAVYYLGEGNPYHLPPTITVIPAKAGIQLRQDLRVSRSDLPYYV